MIKDLENFQMDLAHKRRHEKLSTHPQAGDDWNYYRQSVKRKLVF